MLIFRHLMIDKRCCIFINLIFKTRIFGYTNQFFRVCNSVLISKYSFVKCKSSAIVICIYEHKYNILNLKESESRILND